MINNRQLHTQHFLNRTQILIKFAKDFALLNNAFTLKSMSHGIDPNTGEPFATFNFRYDGDVIQIAREYISI